MRGGRQGSSFGKRNHGCISVGALWKHSSTLYVPGILFYDFIISIIIYLVFMNAILKDY